MDARRGFLETLGLELPIVQAPMAGVSTAALAAAVSNAGALGSIAVGALDPATARTAILAVRERTQRPFNVNVFAHARATRDRLREAAWIERLRPLFEHYGASPPAALREIYATFVDNEAMLGVLLECAPRVVSFHFGLPSNATIAQLRDAGCTTLATATCLREAQRAAEAGVDAIVAQGYEAGGHRGIFDPYGRDDQLDTIELTRELVAEIDRPIIAAGGIMDGIGIAAVLELGAVAAQLGTAFIGCPESSASLGFRAALERAETSGTVMTSAISGRPARCLSNAFTRLGEGLGPEVIPDYPVAYDAGKALDAAARARGDSGFGALWAGEGAPRARSLPAAALVATLVRELREAVPSA